MQALSPIKTMNQMKKIAFTLCYCSLLISIVCAQESAIKGRVTDTNGVPLEAVTVAVTETGASTMTDGDGAFVINASVGQTLRFSLVGAEAKTVAIVDTRPVDVQLDINFDLEEVVVTGYQTQRKADLTGAVSVVKMDEVTTQPTGNIMKTLQGRVPGTFITTSGSPDGAADVRIRGIGTLGNSNPLYIIDGMPSTKSMNEIATLDIESIQILKDASSASIYGSRAANGVIIITTKKGQRGSTKVEARISSSIKNYAKSLEWLDTEQRGYVQWQAARNDGTDPNFGVYGFEDHQDAQGNWVLDRVVIPEFIDAAKTMRAANTDWVDEVGRNAVIQNYNLNLSTGGENSKALFSLDYFDSDGTVRGTYFDRLSARINSDFSLLKGRLTLGENFSITKATHDVLGSTLGVTRNIQPIVPVHTVDGVGWGGPVAGMSDRQNPVRLIEDNKQNNNHMLRLFGDVFLDLQLLENLKFRSMLGMDYSFSWQRNMQKTYTSGFMSEPTASLVNYNNRWGNYVWNNTLTYKLDLKDKHHFDFLAGQELISYYSENLQAGRREFTSEDPDYMYLDAGEGAQTNSGSATEYRLLSYFGKINYNFADKYLASVTTRYDGSSRFGSNNPFGLFPAFSLGWRISEEDFFKSSLSFVSDFKLRFGWGQTGNQEIGDFASYGMYEARYGTNPTWDPDNGTAYDINGTGTGTLPSGYRRIQQSNPNLRWETATQNNFGVDFGLFGQRISGSFDYFTKNTDDILIQPPFIATLGEGGNRWVNGASMTNKGYEFLLTYANGTEKLRYTITGNLAGYRNKVTKLPEDVINSYPGNGVDQTILGRPLNSLFGYVADGLFRTPEEVTDHATQIGSGVGRIRYVDVNGNGTISDEDRTWLGVADPKFVYGINFSISYKRWDAGMFWNGLYGGLVNNGAKGYTDFISFFGGENYGTRVLGAWSPQNPDSDIPALSFNDLNDEKRFSTYFIESASYFKLRTLEVGYTVSPTALQRIGLQGVRVFALGENLVTFKKGWGENRYTGVDPETPNSGYPIPFSLTFGATISF